MGFIAAQILCPGGRYEKANTGFYYGFVSARFHSPMEEPYYEFRIRGETESRWCWSYPTNFTYRKLDLEWDTEPSHGAVTLSLPSLIHESPDGKGTLTRAVLAGWISGAKNDKNTSASQRVVNAMLGFIEAAGRGSLPPVKHHGYFYKEPVDVEIMHWTLGLGISWLAYIWGGIWLLLVVLIGRRLWKRQTPNPANASGATTPPSPATHNPP